MITPSEAKSWLASEGYVRCSKKDNGVIFEAMLWDEDAVVIRQSSSIPANIYIISLDVFCDAFNPLGDLDDSPATR